MKRQATLQVQELRVGIVYRDLLSGYLVLVRTVELSEGVAAGLMWNPIHGAHTPVVVYDNMLIRAEYLTALKPDTRNDDGYHGK